MHANKDQVLCVSLILFLNSSKNLVDQKHSDLKTLDKKSGVLNQVSCLVNQLFLIFDLN